jgi:hypothetical protein
VRHLIIYLTTVSHAAVAVGFEIQLHRLRKLTALDDPRHDLRHGLGVHLSLDHTDAFEDAALLSAGVDRCQSRVAIRCQPVGHHHQVVVIVAALSRIGFGASQLEEDAKCFAERIQALGDVIGTIYRDNLSNGFALRARNNTSGSFSLLAARCSR